MDLRPLLLRAVVGTAIAVVGVVAVLLLARSTGDPVVVRVAGGPQAVSVAVAAQFTVFGGIAGLLLAVVARWLPRPRVAFLTITVAGLLLSLVPPFASAPVPTALWLDAMHIVAGATVIPMLVAALPRARVRR